MRNDPRSTGVDPRGASGAVLVTVMFFVMLMAAVAFSLFFTTTGTNRATMRHFNESTLLYIAEAGLDYNVANLVIDPLYPALDTVGFSADTDAVEYVSDLRELTLEGADRHIYRLRVQYLDEDVPVLFADRSDPDEAWTRIRVTCSASRSGIEREVTGWYSFEMMGNFGGALVSDSFSTGLLGLGAKKQAQQGDVVFSGPGGAKTHYILGDILANGKVHYYGAREEILTDEIVADRFAATSGEILQELADTEDEIPDFTAIGSDEQLFDFPRFEAAASAGAGRVFDDLASFTTAMNEANTAGTPLEGIIVVYVDQDLEGSKPVIGTGDKKADFDVPGGINVRGTLLFHFAEGTDPLYKVVLEVALNINAADLSAWNPSDPATYTTGYPPVFTTGAPWSVDISPEFDNFAESSDYPALMFNSAIVDIHGATNICGVVYGPSFIEIENKQSNLMFFNGSIIGGAGILVENPKATGVIAVHHDPATMNTLATDKDKGKLLRRTALNIR